MADAINVQFDDVPAPAAECWLHPAVEVRESVIEGRGLFARESFDAGAAVSRLGGRLVTDSELDEIFRTSDGYVDTISVCDGINLVLPPRVANGYGNHSCEPNLWWSDAYTLVTRRPVDAGEELTSDYGTSSDSADFVMPCSCGADRCRGRVTGRDWQRPELVEIYGQHWVPGLLQKIAAHRQG